MNQKYPKRQTQEVQKGEKIEFVEGVEISVTDFRWFSEEEKAELKNTKNWEPGMFDSDEEFCEVTVTFENHSEIQKEISNQYLMLESQGISNGNNFIYESAFPERYGTGDEILEPGEKREVTHLYNISSLWFHNKDWEHVKEREYWLTFTSYPIRTVLWLQ